MRLNVTQRNSMKIREFQQNLTNPSETLTKPKETQAVARRSPFAPVTAPLHSIVLVRWLLIVKYHCSTRTFCESLYLRLTWTLLESYLALYPSLTCFHWMCFLNCLGLFLISFFVFQKRREYTVPRNALNFAERSIVDHRDWVDLR